MPQISQILTDKFLKNPFNPLICGNSKKITPRISQIPTDKFLKKSFQYFNLWQL